MEVKGYWTNTCHPHLTAGKGWRWWLALPTLQLVIIPCSVEERAVCKGGSNAKCHRGPSEGLLSDDGQRGRGAEVGRERSGDQEGEMGEVCAGWGADLQGGWK